jgi:NAD-dependent DNA ligase
MERSPLIKRRLLLPGQDRRLPKPREPEEEPADLPPAPDYPSPWNRSTVLRGKNFCITGTLSKPRKAISNLIIRNGGMVWPSCNTHVNYLIVGLQPGQAKLRDAKKRNIPIITEDELRRMMQPD